MRLAVLAGAACLLVACARPMRDPGVKPEPARRQSARGMPLPVPAAEVARLLAHERFEIGSMERTRGGVTLVTYRAELHFARRGVELPVKWKVAPAGGEGWNNVAHKELAAFVIQQWVLDPEDWVVPPTAIRCIPRAEHRKTWDVDPIVEGTDCVLGTLAAWLRDVREADVILDPDRFRGDAGYAGHRADMNLVAYLIDHRDGRVNNFLVPNADDGRIFLVDNGISFGGLVWNYFRPNWNVIRVPAFRREAIDRLRRITAADVNALLVLTQLRADSRGVLEPTERGAPWNAEDGARLRPGEAQFGLTEDEASGLAARVQRILARVDAGEIGSF